MENATLTAEAPDPADHSSYEPVVDWLAVETNCSEHAARQAVEYIAAQQAALNVVPTQTRVVFERFFDESGGMQLVVHAPFGGRINRAWGLAMRKRFCRSFDFELQASADDEGFILSLGPQHSFPIESLFPMLRTDNVRNLLEQALLAVPLFQMRWRWNVTRALQVDRRKNGRKVAPALQRFRSEDLLTAVFPKLTGCQEEHTGDHEIPDHPLVQQTVQDCLQEALDLEGLSEILERLQRGEITFVAKDTREPSPFAYELLNANPYAFLDGGEIQERRARMATTRRSLSIESVQDLGRLDPDAITQVVREAQPLVRNADELHDVLLSRLWLPIGQDYVDRTADAIPPHPIDELVGAQVAEWRDHFAELAESGRATALTRSDGRSGWTATERLAAVRTMFPDGVCDPIVEIPSELSKEYTSADARVMAARGFMEIAGPVTPDDVARHTGMTIDQASASLEALEGEGVVLRGHFTSVESDDSDNSMTTRNSTRNSQRVEWCHRRLLARIHRLTVAGLRREIEPVDLPTFVRFLTRHQGVLPGNRRRGPNGLYEVIAQLQGIDVPAIAWERDVLPLRVEEFRSSWLDELCLTGEVAWGRLYPPARDPEKSRPMASITRIVPVSVFLRDDLPWLLATGSNVESESLSTPAQDVLTMLEQRGAMFATDLLQSTQMLAAQIDETLGELVVRGFVTSDGFAGLRTIARAGGAAASNAKSRRASRAVTRRRSASGAGRWSVWRTGDANTPAEADNKREQRREVVEHWAWQLLRRWGVVFRDLVQIENGAPPWWELTQVFRRLEARGEIRGGRFVSGVSGEQFALGDTVRELRRLRDEPASLDTVSAELVVLSAADPLNLTGVLTAQARVPSRPSNRIIMLNGHVIASEESGDVQVYENCPLAWEEQVRELCTTRQTAVEATRETPGTAAENQRPEEGSDRHAQRLANRRSAAERSSSSRIPRPRFF